MALFTSTPGEDTLSEGSGVDVGMYREQAGPIVQKAMLSCVRSSLTQMFVVSYVDFVVAHLSVLMVQILPYPKIPTLNGH